MAIDVSTLSPQARADYIRIGRHFGSSDTLAQANATLQALDVHGDLLVRFGFSQSDRRLLAEARDELEAAGVARSFAEAGKTTNNQTYFDAMRDGKQARLVARSVLANVERELYQRNDSGNETVITEIRTVLGKTQSAGADDEALARQLELLAQVLRNPVVMEAGADRGVRQSLEDVTTAIGRIRSAAHVRVTKPGTPAETERLDLIDGLIVSLARSARRAARLAAAHHGSPALAKAFELSKLYPWRSKSKSTNEASEAPASTPTPAC